MLLLLLKISVASAAENSKQIQAKESHILADAEARAEFLK